jgi:hypothetical protein
MRSQSGSTMVPLSYAAEVMKTMEHLEHLRRGSEVVDVLDLLYVEERVLL